MSAEAVAVGRSKCARVGHKWKAWTPGSDVFCARLFCEATAKGHHSVLIDLARRWTT